MKLIIAVANHKGGAGKTTLAMLLAGQLASDTYRVAVVDTDPQASALVWSQAGDGKFPAKVVAAKAATLPAVLAELADFDAVFIDCPPNAVAAETLAAIDAAHLVVVPCIPAMLDYWATDALLNAADLRKPGCAILVVVNQMNASNLARELAGHITTTWPTAKARLGSRTVYREAAAQGLALRQLQGRTNHDAHQELTNLCLEVLTHSTKAA
jgi:chromosome partitioning protein